MWMVFLQWGEERARTRAACAQEGGYQEPAVGRRHRPRRPGEHALPRLLPGQKQADEGPAVGRVSGSSLISSQPAFSKS